MKNLLRAPLAAFAASALAAGCRTPPKGDEIPEDYDEIELGGKTYYQVEDTLFKPTIINGKLTFEVACNL